VSEREDGPGGGYDDQREKKKLGGDTWPLALREALAQKAKGAQTHGGLRIQQLTVSTIAA
jgi:hypothetical protein